MPTPLESDLDQVFHALAHPIRRALLESLAEGPDTIVSLAEPHDVSLNAVSKHIKTLEDAGLVVRVRDRTYHRMTFRPEAMSPAMDWMARYTAFWRANLGALKQHMELE